MKKEKYITLSADKRYLRLQIRKNGKTFSRQYIISEYGTTAKAMRAAIADRDDVLLQIRQGVYAEKSGKTFKEVFDEMPSLFPKRMRTYEKYASLHRCYLTSLDDMPIEKVTEEDIMLCLNRMVSTASSNTISQTVSMLRFIFRTARIKKYIMINPMDAVIVPKSEHEANHRRATVSISELMQVIDGFESTTGQSNRIIFERRIIAYALRLIYFTGVRPAEAFALTRDDVDLVNKIIHVRSELDHPTQRPTLYAKLKQLFQLETFRFQMILCRTLNRFFRCTHTVSYFLCSMEIILICTKYSSASMSTVRSMGCTFLCIS